MKIRWHGHACFEITLENGTVIVTDPFDATVGYPLCEERADVALTSHGHFDHNHVVSLKGDPEVISTAGARNIAGAKIKGVRSFHDPKQGLLRGENIIFSIEADGVRLVHLGDLGHMPDAADQKAVISGCDLILIPIGGTYTITADQAAELIRTYAPKAAIAMHYKNDYCRFDIATRDDFVAATGARVLENPAAIVPGSLSGTYIMNIQE